jgi:hypothetical protein
MGTRSGDRDPGVLVYLMCEKKFDAAMLNRELQDRATRYSNPSSENYERPVAYSASRSALNA